MADAAERWLKDPENAYADWQDREAVGADRRHFSARSVIQHRAMYRRFLRALLGRGIDLAHFDAKHIEAFFAQNAERFAEGTTTRLRYLKLLDRLARQLVEDGVRRENPVSALLQYASWPSSEPVPLYMPPEADKRLQDWLASARAETAGERRDLAIVALLLGTGVTAVELRQARLGELRLDAAPPYLHVDEHGPRAPRTVAVDDFALPALRDWLAHHPRPDAAEERLFPGERGPEVSPAALCRIVRAALLAIGFTAPDMSPRVLRNTWGRRRLLAGEAQETVSRLMGLVSSRTVVRLQQTIGGSGVELD